jgi:hypothetical protein
MDNTLMVEIRKQLMLKQKEKYRRECYLAGFLLAGALSQP